MIEIIKEKEAWDKQLALIKQKDFYHTYDYHHISKKPDEDPVLLKYSDEGTVLFLPLLVRPICNSDYRDATSVYGYVGVLTMILAPNFDKTKFHNTLKAFFLEHKIISVFSRFHPFIDGQESLIEGLGTVCTLGKVVYIDLKRSLDEQRQMFNRRLKTYLNKARRECTLRESRSGCDIDIFVDLYHRNMKRINATESYFFDRDYFHKLMQSNDFETKLILCAENETNTIIAGALFVIKDKFVQFHLSGLNENYFHLNAIKLIIDEMRILSTNQEYDLLNLGGGRGSDEDSLFAFKRHFSKLFKDFKIWKCIVDEDAYRAIVEDYYGMSLETVTESVSFFPAYRALKQPIIN